MSSHLQTKVSTSKWCKTRTSPRSTTMRWKSRRLLLNQSHPWESPNRMIETPQLSVAETRSRCRDPSYKWCKCTSSRSTGSATSVRMVKTPTTASISQKKVPEWWWFQMNVFSRIRDAVPETIRHREADPRCSLHNTLLYSKRLRVVQARSLGSSSPTKLQGHHTENKSQILGHKPLTASSWLESPPSIADRCLPQSKVWVSTAMKSPATVFQKPLSISVWKQRTPSKMCIKGWENTKDPTGKPAFPKLYSKANLIRWEEAQASSSKKLLQLLAKI